MRKYAAGDQGLVVERFLLWMEGKHFILFSQSYKNLETSIAALSTSTPEARHKLYTTAPSIERPVPSHN